MSKAVWGKGLVADRDQTMVDRAIAEIRAARPVLITAGSTKALVVGVEGLDAAMAAEIDTMAEGSARLALPAARLRRLGLDRRVAGVVALPVVSLSRIETLSVHLDARVDAPVAPTQDVDDAALELSALALILPPMIVVPVEDASVFGDAVLKVTAKAVHAYRKSQVRDLHVVGRAPVPLEGAPETEFVVFRGGEGLRDQVAIVVGKIDVSQPISVRLHSACLTGDLFGSLKCDCGDQLRSTVQWMADNEGGILLYLDQEGRGNGISNKMRAYKLQSQGWDTYDADEALGFDLDQRHFDFAAEMLKQLGIGQVRVLTNNPQKIGALRKAGLEVVADQRVIGRFTAENVRYLASKRDRAGHFIDFDAVNVRAAPQD